MSRQAPFPSRRRSPSLASNSGYDDGTPPLKVSRSRPNSPAGGVPGPVRPQRSERRARPDELSNRDSMTSSYSQPPPRTRPVQQEPRSRPQRLKSPVSAEPESPSPVTPTMSSVMSAFSSAGTRRRQMTNGSDEFEYQREKQAEMEAERKRQQRIRDRAPGRKVNGKTRAGDIDAVLDQVKDGWEFVIDSDFNSVDLALQLLDEKTYGNNMDSFRRTKHMLSRALKGSVDKHYQAFAASLPHHASLLSHLSTTQSQIGGARTALQEAKDSLGSKRADLVQLWSRSQILEEMIRILDQIEHLRSVPDSLETLMSEKRLLQAAILLVRSLKVINKPEMMEIGAVADLRSYLISQEQALREILVDELQSHLYLKTFWCESRWTSYVPGQQSISKVEFEEDMDAKTFNESSPTSPSFRQTRLTHFINDLALRSNDPPYDLDDHSARNKPSSNLLARNSALSASSLPQSAQTLVNPESDSFSYIETLLESLAVLGKLGHSLDNISQRVSSEIFNLVEVTLEEVSERADFTRRGSSTGETRLVDSIVIVSSVGGSARPASSLTAVDHSLSSSILRLSALEASLKHSDHETLKDLFWTLYSKLDAVAQGFRVVHEVANRIGSRRDFKDASGAKVGSLFSIGEVWVPVQTEVRTLLYDYLTEEGQGSLAGRNPISSVNEVLREGKFIRDRTKAVFRFVDTDAKITNRTLRPHEEELTRVLRDTVPGLVQTANDNAVQTVLSGIGPDDQILGSSQHHRTLIRPDAFHVSVLFQPTLAFLERIAEILPSGAETARQASTVLDDFVLKVYLPQLEDKVESLFHQAVHGTEAFQMDPLWMRLSPRPLAKAATQVVALVNSLCAMLRTSPYNRDNYSRLIMGVIIQFYQRCSDRLQDLVSLPMSEGQLEAKLVLAAQWAQRPEVVPCLSELLDSDDMDAAKRKQLCTQETHLELNFLGSGKIERIDLIPTVKNLAALASLYYSVTWFVDVLSSLRTGSDDLLSPTTAIEPTTAITPWTPHLPSLPVASTDQLILPLSKEMALRFQAILKTFEQLSSLILDTIRIDIRCRAIHYIDVAMRQGNYSVDRDVGEPDANILDFNSQLGEADDCFTSGLPKKEHDFVFLGLGQLMEHVLISRAKCLHRPSTHGVRKIIRNIQALQQSMRTITDDLRNSEFENAKRYYNMFFAQPQDMIAGIRRKQAFTFDEYQIMLNLQCGVNPSLGESGVAESTDRNYSMYMIDLHGLELEKSSQ